MPNVPDRSGTANLPGEISSAPTNTGAPLLRPAGEYAGLTPGAILAARFRIVSLLGRGGMGEVYRAEDLKLGQPVALKFLPGPIDQARLDRFYGEVRLGRQVAHPNVCRIYDVIEADGRHFLVMEYVDGEDLASLLRRIGRLPQDKATEIARGLCAGLAAAHEKGILHRDLKPANVMIDGRGHARLTDFGLAALAGEAHQDARAGTPAYMAPEQLRGEELSVRSDLYSLGLVFYEIFTGRRAWDAGSVSELLKLRSDSSPATPSSLVRDLDPAIERLILRCLERDPDARPATAYALLAAFPGGDPLQAAILAGETPSPEMLAAASKVGDLRPPVAWACLSLFVLGLVAAGILSRRTAFYRQVPFDKPPEVMVERARQIVRLAGVADAPTDWAGWYEFSGDQELYCGRRDVCFVYRQSASFDPSTGMAGYLATRSGSVRRDDPPLRSPGMLRVVLTTEGRLTEFSVVPPSREEAKPRAAPDWSPFLKESGFDLAELTPADAVWTPPVGSDARAAWQVKDSKRADGAMRLEAASFRDRPVDFRVVWRWDGPKESIPWEQYPLFHRLFGWWGMTVLGNLGVVLAALVLAQRNLRLRRSDSVGAFRTAVFFFAARGIASLLTAHHVASPLPEARMLRGELAEDAWDAASVWLLYVALEPYARRRWPETLISWSRLLAGRLRDPLVGRDVLAGSLCGTLMGLLWHLSYFASPGGGLRAPSNFSNGLRALNGGVRFIVADLLHLLGSTVDAALLTLFLLATYRMIVRREGLAILLLLVTHIVFNIWWCSGRNLPLELTFLTLIMVILVATLVRFGLLASAAAGFVFLGLRTLPIVLDFAAWYAGHSLFALGLLLLPALYAFHVSLAGRQAFGGRFLEE